MGGAAYGSIYIKMIEARHASGQVASDSHSRVGVASRCVQLASDEYLEPVSQLAREDGSS
jgi:hypothetical protein